jgi:hypothetical protein
MMVVLANPSFTPISVQARLMDMFLRTHSRSKAIVCTAIGRVKLRFIIGVAPLKLQQ